MKEVSLITQRKKQPFLFFTQFVNFSVFYHVNKFIMSEGKFRLMLLMLTDFTVNYVFISIILYLLEVEY